MTSNPSVFKEFCFIFTLFSVIPPVQIPSREEALATKEREEQEAADRKHREELEAANQILHQEIEKLEAALHKAETIVSDVISWPGPKRAKGSY